MRSVNRVRLGRTTVLAGLALAVCLTTLPAPALAAGDPGLPVRVRIPKLKVNTGLTYVARASNGSMAVPKKANAVAWFKLGTRPGAVGSAVFGGHAAWGGRSAVFARLGRLKVRDKIYVQDNKGQTFTFVVRKVKFYNAKSDAREVFNRNDGRYLNLVTCTGTWNARLKTHNKRLVVCAVAVP